MNDRFAKYKVGSVADEDEQQPVQDVFAKYKVTEQQPIDRFSKYKVEAQPTPRPVKFMDWNLQKALRNQGVDPMTMKVVDPSKDWGVFKKIVRSIQSGNAEFKMDIRMGQAAESDTDVYAQYKAEEELYKQAKAANPIEGDNWFTKSIYGAANSVAGMAYSIPGKVVGSAVGLGVATGVAALTPIPGDEIAIGGAFVAKLLGKSALTKAGGVIGGAMPYYLQGRGSLYRDMREMGVDHETAQNAARIGAAPYAAIEFINDYIPGEKILGKVAPGLFKKAKPVISKSITEAVLRTMKKWGISSLAEASEEFFQEVSNEVTKNIAATLDDIPESQATPAFDVFKQGMTSFIDAIGPSMILGGLPTAMYGVRQAKMSQAYNALHDMGIDEETSKYMVATFTGSELAEVKDLKTNDQVKFMDAVINLAETRIGEQGVKEIMMDNPDMSEDSLLHILASPAPRAAYLAWQHEGDVGVKKINDQQSLQSADNKAMMLMVDDKEIPVKDKVKILTAPNMYKALQDYMAKEVSEDEKADQKGGEVSGEKVSPVVEVSGEEAGTPGEVSGQEGVAVTPPTEAAAPAAGSAVAETVTPEVMPAGQTVTPPPAAKDVEAPAVAETNIRKTALDRYSEILSSDVRGGSIGDVRDVLDGEALRVASKYLPPDARIEVRVGTVPEGETAYMQPKTSVRGPRIIIPNDPEMLMRETDQQDIGSAIAQVVIHEIGHAANDIAGKDWMSEADSSKMEAEIASILRKPVATPKQAVAETPPPPPSPPPQQPPPPPPIQPKVLLQPGETPASTADLFMRDKVQYEGKEYIVAGKEGKDSVNIRPAGVATVKLGDQVVTKQDLKTMPDRAQRQILASIFEQLENGSADPVKDAASQLDDRIARTEDKRDQEAMQWLNENIENITFEGLEVTTVPVSELTLVDRDVKTIVDKPLGERLAEAKDQYPTANDAARKLLSDLSIEPALAGKAAQSTLDKVAAALGKDITADTIVDNIEAVITGLDKGEKTILLGRLSSPFALAHEMHHALFETLNSVPEYHAAMMTYFDALFNSTSDVYAKWRKTESGKQFVQANRAAFEQGRINTGMREMMARMIEVSLARESAKYDLTGRPRGQERRSIAKELYDALPESLKQFIDKIADLFALMWKDLNSMRSDWKAEQYKMPLMKHSTPLAIDTMNRRLLNFEKAGGINADAINRLRAELAPRLAQLRQQLIDAYTALNEAGKLPQIKKALTESPKNTFLAEFKKMPGNYALNAEGYIRWMADAGASIMERMAINTALMQVKTQQVAALRSMIIDVANNALVDAPSAGIHSAQKAQKPYLTNIVDLIQTHVSRVSELLPKRKDKVLAAVRNIEPKLARISVPEYARIIADQWWNEYGHTTKQVSAEDFTKWVLNEMTRKLVPTHAIRAWAEFRGEGRSPKDAKPYAVIKLLTDEVRGVRITDEQQKPDQQTEEVTDDEQVDKDMAPPTILDEKPAPVADVIGESDSEFVRSTAENPADLLFAYDSNNPAAKATLLEIFRNEKQKIEFLMKLKAQLAADRNLKAKSGTLLDIIKNVSMDAESDTMASAAESTMASAANERYAESAMNREMHQEMMLGAYQEVFARKSIDLAHPVMSIMDEAVKGQKFIRGKSDRAALTAAKELPTIQRLGALMALAMRGRPDVKTQKIINDITKGIADAATEGGQILRFVKEMYSDASHTGRMMLLGMMFEKMDAEKAKKYAAKALVELSKRLPEEERAFLMKVLGEKGFTKIVDDGIGDGPTPKPKAPDAPGSFGEGFIDGIRVGVIRGVAARIKANRTGKPNTLFSSSTADTNVEGESVLDYAAEVFSNILRDDMSALNAKNEDKTLAAILSTVKKAKKAEWDAASEQDRAGLKKELWELVIASRNEMLVALQSNVDVIQSEQDITVDGANQEGSEQGKLVSKFVSLMEEYAKEYPDAMLPMSDKDTAQAIIRALMNRVKQDSLVEAGKKPANLRPQFRAVERLSAIAANAELAQQIWQEAQVMVEGMEELAPKAQEFLQAMLSNLFSRNEVEKALSFYIEHGNEVDFPAAFKNANGEHVHRLNNIRNVTANNMIPGIDGQITDAQIEEAVEKTAIAFVEDLFRHSTLDKSVVDGLIETSRDILREQVKETLEHKANVLGEAKSLANSIIRKLSGPAIKPNSAEGNAAKVLLKAMQVSGIMGEKFDQSIATVSRKLGLQVQSAPVNKAIIMETIAELRAAIKAASEVDAPQFMVNMRGELAAMMDQIRHSTKLKEFMAGDGLLRSTVDQAISQMLHEYSNNGESVGVTMRKIIYANYNNMNFVAKKIAVEIARNTGLPESMTLGLVKNVESRFVERFLKTRKHELESIMGKSPAGWKPSVDKLERILIRIHLGAADTPDMAQRLAEYMGIGGMDTATRERFRAMSQAIEDRGLVVNHNDPGIAQGSPQDKWYSSAERRVMLRNFYNEMNRVKGYTMMDKASTWYFFALLSGMSTQEVNFMSTGLQAATHTLAKAFATHVMGDSRLQWRHDWRGLFNTMGEFFKGFNSSIMSDVPMIVRTGNVYGPRISEMAASKHTNFQEQEIYDSKFWKPWLKLLRVPGRMLQAMDTLMANAAFSAHQAMLSRTQAVELGLTGSDLEIAEKVILASRLHRSSVFDVTTQAGVDGLLKELHRLDGKITPKKYAELQEKIANMGEYAEQAFFELKGDSEFTQQDVNAMSREDRVKYYKRIDELQFEALTEAERDDLIRNSGEATFNFSEHPLYDQTYIGKITKSILEMRRDIPGLQFILPFVRIVGRVMDLSMDYTPIGLWRANTIRDMMFDETSGVKFSKVDVDTMKTKALFGSLTTTAVFIGALASMVADDDDDDWFQITAKGPSDRDKANIMREGKGYGFQESSIRIGRKWFSYKYTPLVIPFTLLGSVFDVLRYDVGVRRYRNASAQEKELMGATFQDRVVKGFFHGIARSVPAMFEQSYMNSLSDFMEVLSTPNEEVRRGKMTRLMARISTGFIPNFVKQVNRSFDPSLYSVPEDMNEFVGQALRDLPMPAAWKGSILLRRYNVLGEPIRLTSPSVFSSLIEMTLREKENRPTNLGRFISAGQQSDPVWTWLAKNDVRLPAVTSSEQLLGIPMTDEIRQEYAVRRGKTLKNIFEYLNKGNALDKLTEDQSQKLVSALVPQVSKTIKAAMVTDPAVVRELAQNRRAEIWKKYGILLPDRK